MLHHSLCYIPSPLRQQLPAYYSYCIDNQFVAPFLSQNQGAGHGVGGDDAVDRLGGTDTIVVIGKRQVVGTNRSGFQPAAILPGEVVGAAVVAGQRIADFIVGEAYPSVGSQQVSPAVVVAIGVGAVKCCGRSSSGCQGVGFL